MEQRLTMNGGGTLFWRQEGERVVLRAERSADGRGLYKVWLGKGGADCFLLGTLLPEGGCLRLLRSVPRRELERVGCWPPEQARVGMVFAFRTQSEWYREEQPGRLLRDPDLGCELPGPMLCSRGAEGFRLASPFRTDGPVPIPALFCLAGVEPVEGKLHWIWHFDGTGRPVFPHSGTQTGDTTIRTGG